MFRRIPPPTEAQLQALVERIAQRVGHGLERRGLLARATEGSYLELDAAGGLMDDLLGHSITYRVAVGAGQTVFTLQTVPGREDDEPRQGVAQYGAEGSIR